MEGTGLYNARAWVVNSADCSAIRMNIEGLSRYLLNPQFPPHASRRGLTTHTPLDQRTPPPSTHPTRIS